MSDREQMVAVAVRLVEEAYQAGGDAVIEDSLAPDYVDHADYLQDSGKAKAADRQAYTQMAAMHRDAISNLRVDVADVIAQEDRVMVRTWLTGRHAGELYGIPATGNELSFGSMDMFRFRDDKIVEHWWCRDDRLLYRQIGALPPMLVSRVRTRMAEHEEAPA